MNASWNPQAADDRVQNSEESPSCEKLLDEVIPLECMLRFGVESENECSLCFLGNHVKTLRSSLEFSRSLDLKDAEAECRTCREGFLYTTSHDSTVP